MSEQNPDIIDVVDTTDKEQHTFQADAAQILKLVSHSIYSDRDIFLRDLLLNFSDALDTAIAHAGPAILNVLIDSQASPKFAPMKL